MKLCDTKTSGILKFTTRLMIFFANAIRQLTAIQHDLSSAARSVDLAAVEKRNLRAMASTVLTIDETVDALLSSLEGCTELQKHAAKWLEAHPETLQKELELSDWATAINTNSISPMILDGLEHLSQQEDSLLYPEWIAIHRRSLSIDHLLLQIFHDLVAIGLLGQSLLNTARSYAELLSVSVIEEDLVHPLLRSLRDTSQEIQRLTSQIHENLARLCRLLNISSDKNEDFVPQSHG